MDWIIMGGVAVVSFFALYGFAIVCVLLYTVAEDVFKELF
jgi:hypothetical protein